MEPQFVQLVTVRCLACDETYGKPAGRGTMKTNPGCPECGYLGWIAVGEPLSEREERLRFGGDLLPRPFHQRG
jgi:hypothetical protein